MSTDVPLTTDDGVVHEGDQSISEAISQYWDKVRGGELGSLPAILGLVALVGIFGALKGDVFLTSFNFANLLTQSSMVIVLAMGLVFVLLLGEIDLSAGFGAGTCAAVLAVAMTQKGLPWYIAVVAALLTGALIGLFIGVLVARLGIPSFVVTLAMFLGLQGLMLLIIGDGGTIAVKDPVILALENNNLSVLAGWVLFAVVVLGYALATGRRIMTRRSQGLTTQSTSLWLAKIASLALLYGAFTWQFSKERSLNPQATSIKGVPYIVPLILLAVPSIAIGAALGFPFADGVLVHGLEPIFHSASAMLAHEHEAWTLFGIDGLLMLASVTVASIGTVVGVRLFRSDSNEFLGRVTKRLQPLYDGSRSRWYFDDLNDLVFVRFGRKLANALWWFDRRVVDGTVNGVATLTSSGGRGLRQIQTGRVQNYALGIAFGLVAIAAAYLVFAG